MQSMCWCVIEQMNHHGATYNENHLFEEPIPERNDLTNSENVNDENELETSLINPAIDDTNATLEIPPTFETVDMPSDNPNETSAVTSNDPLNNETI